MKAVAPHSAHDEANNHRGSFIQRAVDPMLTEEEEMPFVSAKRLGIQPKLTIGAPNDPYEQEADAMAEHVMRMPLQPEEAPVISRINTANNLQRMCSQCENEMQVQRSCDACEEEMPIQRSESSGTETHASSHIANRIQSRRGQGTPLPISVQKQMGQSFGTDFSNARIHTNSESAQISQELNAQAFTHGFDIYFNQGKYSPESYGGKHLLAHELTHVIQQGATAPSIQKTPLGTLAPLHDITVQARDTIEEWRRFLRNADDRNNALELNAFMAKAIGHITFDTDRDFEDRRQQQQILDQLQTPTHQQCVLLMAAFLTTSDIDIIGWWGDLLSGYLFTTFTNRYYLNSIEYIAQQRSHSQDADSLDSWQINSDFVAQFLNQSDSHTEVLTTTIRIHSLSSEIDERLRQAQLVHLERRLNMSGLSIGNFTVSLEGVIPLRSPSMLIMSNAIAGMQAGIAAAFEEAGREERNIGTIIEDFSLRIGLHVRTFKGVVQEIRRIEDLRSAISNALIGASLQALFPIVGQYEFLGQNLRGSGDEGTIDREASYRFVFEMVKTATKSFADDLEGQSADQLESNFQSTADEAMQLQVNRIRDANGGIVPDSISAVKTALSVAFMWNS